MGLRCHNCPCTGMHFNEPGYPFRNLNNSELQNHAKASLRQLTLIPLDRSPHQGTWWFTNVQYGSLVDPHTSCDIDHVRSCMEGLRLNSFHRLFTDGSLFIPQVLYGLSLAIGTLPGELATYASFLSPARVRHKTPLLAILRDTISAYLVPPSSSPPYRCCLKGYYGALSNIGMPCLRESITSIWPLSVINIELLLDLIRPRSADSSGHGMITTKEETSGRLSTCVQKWMPVLGKQLSIGEPSPILTRVSIHPVPTKVSVNFYHTLCLT